MIDKRDEVIKDNILRVYEEFFSGAKHLAVIDNFPSDGRSYESWHDEIVELIDEIRTVENISAKKAGERISAPYLKEHYVTFESFMASFWKRKRERAEELFMRSISDRDINSAVEAYKQLSDSSKMKLVPR